MRERRRGAAARRAGRGARRASAASSGRKKSGRSAPHATSLRLTSCQTATKAKTAQRLRQRAARPPSGTYMYLTSQRLKEACQQRQKPESVYLEEAVEE